MTRKDMFAALTKDELLRAYAAVERALACEIAFALSDPDASNWRLCDRAVAATNNLTEVIEILSGKAAARLRGQGHG